MTEACYMKVRAEPYKPGQVISVVDHVRGQGGVDPLNPEVLRRIEKRLSSRAARELVEHYSVGGDVPLRWVGEAAALVGLNGRASVEEIESVMISATAPDGTYLRGKALEPRSVTMWGMVLGQPKSISLLMADPIDGIEVAEALHRFTTERFLAHLASQIDQPRIRLKPNESLRPLGLLAATATHHVSSEADPHIHEHLLLSPSMPYELTTQHADGSTITRIVWRTVNGRRLQARKFIAAEAATQDTNRLIELVLGVRVTNREGEIYGLDDPGFLMAFSRAREKLLAEKDTFAISAKEDHYLWQAQRRDGASGAIERAFDAAYYDQSGGGQRRVISFWRDAIANHRVGKRPALGLIEQISAYMKAIPATLRYLAQHPDQCDRVLPHFGPTFPETEEALERILSEIEAEVEPLVKFRREAVIERATKVLGGFSPRVEAFVDRYVIPRCLVALTSGAFTTRGLVESDRATQSQIASLADELILPPAWIFEMGEAVLDSHNQWDDNQREAFMVAIASGRKLVGWQGVAGAGKSTLIDAIRQIDEAVGQPIIGVAVGGSAAERLSVSSGIRTMTVAKLLYRLHKSDEQRTPSPLPKGVRLVIDEVSQVGAKDLTLLINAVTKVGGSILAIGDLKQAQAIDGRGAACLLFDEAARVGSFVELKTSYRPTNDDIRELGTKVRGRDLEGVMNVIAREGHVTTSSTADSVTAARAVGEQVAADLADGTESIGLAFTRRDVARISNHVQRLLHGENLDTKAKLPIGELNGQVACRGDRVRNREARYVDGESLLNGDLFTVTELYRDGSLDAFSDRLKKSLHVTREALAKVELAYASTIDSAQGGAWDAAHLLLTGNEGRTRLYSAVTRARSTLSIQVVGASIEGVIGAVISRDDEEVPVLKQVDLSSFIPAGESTVPYVETGMSGLPLDLGNHPAIGGIRYES